MIQKLIQLLVLYDFLCQYSIYFTHQAVEYGTNSISLRANNTERMEFFEKTAIF